MQVYGTNSQNEIHLLTLYGDLGFSENHRELRQQPELQQHQPVSVQYVSHLGNL